MNFNIIRAQRERGNVLFLILIAVALFAALSYAVTQSTRGGGDASSETTLLTSSQIVQYPSTTLKTAVVRMQINGTSAAAISFNIPADSSTGGEANEVFNSAGGGASYQAAPSGAMQDGTNGEWVISSQLGIPDLGTTSAEIIAFLPNVTLQVCNSVNERTGFETTGTPPVVNADMSAHYVTHKGNIITNHSSNSADDTTLKNDLAVAAPADDELDDGSNTFDAAYEGCFQNAGPGEYVFFSVLWEL